MFRCDKTCNLLNVRRAHSVNVPCMATGMPKQSKEFEVENVMRDIQSQSVISLMKEASCETEFFGNTIDIAASQRNDRPDFRNVESSPLSLPAKQ